MKNLVGIGLDFHDNGRQSLAAFYELVLPKISHASIVGLQSVEEATRFIDLIHGLPTIHHLSNVGPANPSGIQWRNLATQDLISKKINAIWCNEDIGAWNIGPYNIPYFTPPLFEADVSDFVAQNIRELQARCSVPFLAELPSCSYVAGRLTLGEFFCRIVAESQCKLLLDVPHLYSYALFTGARPTDVLNSLPHAAVAHLHMAGGRTLSTEKWCYVDSHDELIMPQVLDLLGEVLAACPNVEAITYEVGPAIRDADVLRELDRLNIYIDNVRFNPSLVRSRVGSAFVR